MAFVAALAGALGRAWASFDIGGGVAGIVGRTIARAEYSGAVNRAGSFLVGQISGNWSAELTYRQNAITQNHIPDPAALLHAFWTGHVTLGQLAHNLHWNNIPFRGFEGEQDNFNRETWRGVLRATKPQLDTGLVVDLYRQGIMGEDEATSRLRRNGISWTDSVNYLLHTRGWFNVGVAANLWLQGAMTDADYRDAMRREGIGEARAQDALLSQRSVAPVSAWIDWWRGGWVTDAEYTARLAREGVSNPADHARLLRMRTPIEIGQTRSDYWLGRVPLEETRRRMELLGYGTDDERRTIIESEAPYAPAEALRLYYRGEISRAEMTGHVAAGGIVAPARQDSWIRGSRPTPGAADLVSFAVHEVWDPAVVARLQYDAEFPAQLDYWMQVQGWNWGAQGAALQPVPPGQVDWPVAYWRSHWRPITEQMAHEMFQRLRPDRIARYRQQVPGVEAFRLEDYDRALKILDYSPTNRKWVEAISFNVLPVHTARLLYRTGKRDRQWLIDQMLDRGYVMEDAVATVDAEDARFAMAQQKEAEKLAAKVRRETMDQIARGYVLGTLPREFAVSRLHDLGLEEEVGGAWIDALAAKENLSVVQEGVKRLRAAYLNGEFNPADLMQRLQALALQPDAVRRYVLRWGLQRTQHRRMLSTEKLMHYVALNRIPWRTAIDRLTNLGWSNPDALLMVDEARRKADELEAKAKHAEEVAATKRQRELEATRKRAKKVVTDAEAGLRKMTPVGMLKRLVCEAIVSPQWAGERLQAMGYDDDTVDLYVKDWAAQNAANKKCLPPKEDATSEAPPTQPGTPKPATGKMTLGGVEIPVGGIPQVTAVQPTGKQGPNS